MSPGKAAPTKKSPPSSKRMAFEARVEPIWSDLDENRREYGALEIWRQKRRFGKFVEGLAGELGARDVPLAEGWDRPEGKTVCHIRIDRLGVCHELREYAREIAPKDAGKRFPHLLHLREHHAYYLPFDFPEPFEMPGRTDDETLLIGSSTRLVQELGKVNGTLKVEATFKIKGMKDFVEATEANIAQFESSFNSEDRFWVKFAYLVIQRLSQQSAARRMPLILE